MKIYEVPEIFTKNITEHEVTSSVKMLGLIAFFCNCRKILSKILQGTPEKSIHDLHYITKPAIYHKETGQMTLKRRSNLDFEGLFTNSGQKLQELILI